MMETLKSLDKSASKATQAVEELTELVKKPKRLNKTQSMRYTQRVMPKVRRSKLTKGSGSHKAVTFDEVMNELTYHKRVFVQHLGRFRKQRVREILEACESALFEIGVDHRGLHIKATQEILTLALRQALPKS